MFHALDLPGMHGFSKATLHAIALGIDADVMANLPCLAGSRFLAAASRRFFTATNYASCGNEVLYATVSANILRVLDKRESMKTIGCLFVRQGRA